MLNYFLSLGTKISELDIFITGYKDSHQSLISPWHSLTLSSVNVSSVTRISGTESETEGEAGLSGTVKAKGQEGEEFPHRIR